ncbi:ALK and LTK ligand 1 isoform X1 [Neopsephotus bourkii]|uniref:ALK and LTK ligand 1 isoform X1 n=1 Tax=Neopsephotus bourkii TaxID=309878 RepID=UPI002AA587DC|nr:ALK and LTK ligand 1 isoform X1 [Neopsephotus bourkii]
MPFPTLSPESRCGAGGWRDGPRGSAGGGRRQREARERQGQREPSKSPAKPGTANIAAEMRGAKKRQALPAILLLLLASAPPPPGAEGRDVPSAEAERGALLDFLLQALGDGERPLPPRPPRRDRVISRRYIGGAPSPEPRSVAVAAAAPRPPPAVAPPPPRLFATARHGEIFPRDSTLKDKFIKHFTGPVTFSSECSKHFHRLYHNTRDCSTPAYYKRCARLLTRLAMSPLCTQS